MAGGGRSKRSREKVGGKKMPEEYFLLSSHLSSEFPSVPHSKAPGHKMSFCGVRWCYRLSLLRNGVLCCTLYRLILSNQVSKVRYSNQNKQSIGGWRRKKICHKTCLRHKECAPGIVRIQANLKWREVKRTQGRKLLLIERFYLQLKS